MGWFYLSWVGYSQDPRRASSDPCYPRSPWRFPRRLGWARCFYPVHVNDYNLPRCIPYRNGSRQNTHPGQTGSCIRPLNPLINPLISRCENLKRLSKGFSYDILSLCARWAEIRSSAHIWKDGQFSDMLFSIKFRFQRCMVGFLNSQLNYTFRLLFRSNMTKFTSKFTILCKLHCHAKMIFIIACGPSFYYLVA